MRLGPLARPRAELRGCAQNTFAAGWCLWARVTALPGLVCSSLSACAHLAPSCMGPGEGLCAHLVGPESEGVQARLGALCPAASLLVLHALLSVYLCLPELCLLPSRGSGCRMPAWTWLTSLPPMVSYMSSVRYGWRGVCAGNLLVMPRGKDVLTSSHAPCQVLLPPRGDVLGGQGLLQQLDSVPAFRLFRELLQVRAAGVGSPGWGHPPPGSGLRARRPTPDACTRP